MLFNSFQFIFVFLPITFCVYFGLNYYKKYVLATAFLAVASVVFYAWWEYKNVALLLISITFNYFISGLIYRASFVNSDRNGGGGGNLDSKNDSVILSLSAAKAKYLKGNKENIESANANKDASPFSKAQHDEINLSKKPLILLIIALVFNITLLCYFKYMDFFIESFNALFHTNIALLKIVLPLGISFFTITQIAYIVDCYEGRAVERNIINYALFVTFFPHLIAGPILHHAEMMPQFSLLKNKILRYDNIAKGLFIFSIGLFKKVFIADSFAKWANAGYSALDSGITLNIFEAWATSLSYTFQLYFDFSGYCDMAIGLGLLFNIALPINFASPYKSLNIAEFWRRWHITLGRFLRDYIYIPLGGNRNFRADSIESSLKKHVDSKSILNKILTLRNLFIVAFISGVWHGAGLGFVIWGILHGLAMCLHRIYRYLLETLLNIRLKDSKINVNYLDAKQNLDSKNARNLPYSPVLTTPAHPTHLEKIAQENRANFNQNTESTLPDSINSNNLVNLDSKQNTESNATQNLDSTNAQNIESKTQDSKETAESSGRAGNEIQSETLRQISTNKTLKTDFIESKNLEKLDSKQITDSIKNTESNTLQNLDSIKNTESTPPKSPKIKAFLESKIYKIICWFITFNFINITWIFFRADSPNKAIELIKSMLFINQPEISSKARLIPHFLVNIQGRNDTLIYIILAFILCLCVKNSVDFTRDFKPNKKTTIATMALFWIPLIVMIINPYSEFIYFNF